MMLLEHLGHGACVHVVIHSINGCRRKSKPTHFLTYPNSFIMNKSSLWLWNANRRSANLR